MDCENFKRKAPMNLSAIRPIGPHIEGFIRFASEGERETLRQLNHFEVLSRVHQDPVGGQAKLEPHPIGAELIALAPNKGTGLIKEIPVKLMFNAPDNNLSARYEAYDKDLNRLVCAGDGENFCRTSQIAGQATSGACTGPDSCGYANNGQVRCHFKVRLKVQIDGQTDPFSVFELQSGSINTYRTLSAKLNLMHAAFGGKLRHVPLNLTIWNKSSSESTYLPFYCADLKLAENETMATAIKKANDGATADTNAGLAIDAMEASVKEMQAAGALSLDGSDNAVITFTTNHIPGKTTRRSIAAPKGDDISSVIALAKTAATSSVEPDSAPKTSDVEAVSVAPVVRVPAAAMETAVQMTVPSTKEKPPTPL